jgi:hypothetical protein
MDRSRHRVVGRAGTIRPLTGVVYFLQAEPGDPVKIGYAKDRAGVERRLRAAQLGHPAALRVLAIMDGGRVLEAELHRRFANDRIYGEWFRPSPGLLGLIRASQTPTLDLRDTPDVEAIRTRPRPKAKRWPLMALGVIFTGGLAAQLSPDLALPTEALAAAALIAFARRAHLAVRR